MLASLPCRSSCPASYSVGLQPGFQRRDLPELGAVQRRQMLRRRIEQLVDVVAAHQDALTRRLAVQRVLDELEALPVEVLQLRHREIALLAIDDLRRQHRAGRLLQHEFTAERDLELRRYR